VLEPVDCIVLQVSEAVAGLLRHACMNAVVVWRGGTYQIHEGVHMYPTSA
jgi:hypothetical protein